MIPLPTLPQAIAVSLAVGVAIGGSGVWWFRGIEVGHLELAIERLQADISIANAKAQSQVNDAQRTVDDRTEALTRALIDIEDLHEDYAKQLKEVASRTHPAVGPAPGRVLRHASRPDKPAKGEDSRPPAPAPAAPDPVPRTGYVSESAISAWSNRILEQYQLARKTHRELADIVRALPGVEVVGDGGRH